MERRLALQSLMTVIAGAYRGYNLPVSTTAQQAQTSSNGMKFAEALKSPRSIIIELDWKEIRVNRNGKTITIDPDELFEALSKPPQ